MHPLAASGRNHKIGKMETIGLTHKTVKIDTNVTVVIGDVNRFIVSGLPIGPGHNTLLTATSGTHGILLIIRNVQTVSSLPVVRIVLLSVGCSEAMENIGCSGYGGCDDCMASSRSTDYNGCAGCIRA